MNKLSRSRALSSVALVGGLAVPGLARAGTPAADTWFEVEHGFSGDSCIVASLSVCKLSLDGLTMDCQTEKATDYEGERLGAIAYLIRNESDLDGTDICDGYEYCLFGALKTNVGTSGDQTDDVDGAGEVTADHCSPLDGGGSYINCEVELTEEPSECPAEHPTSLDD